MKKTRQYSGCNIAIIATLLLSLLLSCHKDKDAELKNMSGILLIDAPIYIKSREPIPLKAQGLSTEDNIDISYTWYCNAFETDTIPGNNINITLKDTIGNFTLTVYANAWGYNQQYASVSINIIPHTFEEAITNINIDDAGYFHDIRDGKRYLYCTYGDLDWFVQNLWYEGSGKTYLGETNAGILYGSLYNWEEAQTACPQGWRLPTEEDWLKLAQINAPEKEITSFYDDWAGIAETYCANAQLFQQTIWPFHRENIKSNTTHWNALPSGFISNAGEISGGLGEYSFFWTAAEKDSDNAYYRYLHYANNNFSYSFANKKGFYASVRCVRDTEK